jgi:hypothetical protein
MANDVVEVCWLRQLLQELHAPEEHPHLLRQHQRVYLSTNPIQHQRMKHIEIDLHFVREHVAIGNVCVLHVSTTSQFADIFMKDLSTFLFSEFRYSLNIHRD